MHTGHSLLATCADDGVSEYLDARPRLFRIAYRMLGSASDAEDIVQDVWMRWQGVDRSVVRHAGAFLTTTTIRLAINFMQSARSRRETSVDQWLYEPVDTRTDPGLDAERRQALASGFPLLAGKLTPAERAAFILREAFDYPYRDIARILGLGEANARQVVTRARQHVAKGSQPSTRPPESPVLLEVFMAAAQNGDLASLERLFASEVVRTSDGSGLAHVA